MSSSKFKYPFNITEPYYTGDLNRDPNVENYPDAVGLVEFDLNLQPCHKLNASSQS